MGMSPRDTSLSMLAIHRAILRDVPDLLKATLYDKVCPSFH